MRRGVLGLLAVAGVVALLAPAAHAVGRCGDHSWCDTGLSPDARAGLLLQALTPDEKIGLLAGDDLTGVCACYPGSHTGTERGVSRLDVPPVYFSDGPVGPRQRHDDVRDQRQPRRVARPRADRQIDRVALARPRAFVGRGPGARRPSAPRRYAPRRTPFHR